MSSKVNELLQEWKELNLKQEGIALRQKQIKAELEDLIEEDSYKHDNVTVSRQTRFTYKYTPELKARIAAMQQEEKEMGIAEEDVKTLLVVRVNKNDS